ncbi:MAG TPA: hypothetical protein VEL51_23685, partial [Vicinamibacterales bacterium]|nr:hypothetical protein [Vicinamibacterales bacterium]
PAAGRNNGAIESQGLTVNGDRSAAREAALAEEHVDAGLAQPLGRIMRADVRAPLAHASHDRIKIRLRRADAYAERRRAVCFANRAGRAQQCFRGDTADVQAVATQKATFDERDAGAKPGCADGTDQPGRPTTDDHEIVDVAWLRIDPVLRVHSVDESLIRYVERRDQRLYGR